MPGRHAKSSCLRPCRTCCSRPGSGTANGPPGACRTGGESGLPALLMGLPRSVAPRCRRGRAAGMSASGPRETTLASSSGRTISAGAVRVHRPALTSSLTHTSVSSNARPWRQARSRTVVSPSTLQATIHWSPVTMAEGRRRSDSLGRVPGGMSRRAGSTSPRATTCASADSMSRPLTDPAQCRSRGANQVLTVIGSPAPGSVRSTSASTMADRSTARRSSRAIRSCCTRRSPNCSGEGSSSRNLAHRLAVSRREPTRRLPISGTLDDSANPM
jgi:hypothetical protein